MDRDSEYVEYVSARLPALHRAAYLLCGDPYRADDIVSATTTALYRHWNRVRAADNIDAYVHRVLIRKYTDERRMRWAKVLLTNRVPEQAHTTDDQVEERDSLRAALGELTEGDRRDTAENDRGRVEHPGYPVPGGVDVAARGHPQDDDEPGLYR